MCAYEGWYSAVKSHVMLASGHAFPALDAYSTGIVGTPSARQPGKVRVHKGMVQCWKRFTTGYSTAAVPRAQGLALLSSLA